MSNNIKISKNILWIFKLFLLIDLITLIKNAANDCKEEWNSMTFNSSDWELVGDVSISNSTDQSITFTRDPNDQVSTGDIGGAAWLKINKNNQRGVKISFVPEITLDLNYYGNAKLPQGFAFVFTANPISNVIGAKRSGLGYDGIQSAVAFEWDFIQNTDKNDVRDTHFSAHYNLTGGISSASPSDCNTFCNKKLANFYDVQKQGYVKDVEYTIELYGGILNLYENEVAVLKNVNFPYFDQLMEENEVYFGITSAMNLYKAVTITNLRTYTITNSEKPVLSIPSPKVYYLAGAPLIANLVINSICGLPLKIFPQQIKSDFALSINNQRINSLSAVFNPDNYGLVITIVDLNIAGKAVLTPTWMVVDGTSVELNILPGVITKYDICSPAYDHGTNVIDASLTNGNLFTFTICTSDQFRNKKALQYTTNDALVKIDYPNLIPSPIGLTIVPSKDNTQFVVSVPLTGLGVYTVYNSQFFNGSKKTFEVKMGSAATGNSFGVISNYFQNRNAKVNTQIILNIHLNDFYGNPIANENNICSFENSTIEQTFEGVVNVFKFPSSSIIDGYPSLTYIPQNPGQYTYRPRIQCQGDKNASDLKCNLCTFYISSTVTDFSRFKIFSDFKNAYSFSNEVTLTPLLISLDESSNRKLTTLKFVDTSGMDINIYSITNTSINVALLLNGEVSATVLTAKFNPVGVIDIFTDGNTERTSLFSPLNVYNLLVKINDNNYKLSSDVNIPIQFAYKDDYLNNVNTNDNIDVPANFLSTYMPGSFRIRAASNQLLFKIIARNANKEMTMGNSLNVGKVSLSVSDSNGYKVDLKPTPIKIGIFIYVNVSPTQAGSFTVNLNYDGVIIQTIPLIVTPRNEVNDLKYDSKNVNIANITNNEITLKDADVSSPVSFSMNMIDEFGNVINDNYLSTFNTVSVKSVGSVLIEPLIDGTLTILFNDKLDGLSSVVLTLPNGIQYTINITRKSVTIDPTLSSSEVNGQSTVGQTVKAIIHLNDKFGNDISTQINSNSVALTDLQANLQVYLLGPENTITNLSYDLFNNGTSTFIYSLLGPSMSLAGEHVLNVFYKNVPITCSLCYLNLLPSTIDLTQTTAFMIGYKSEYKLYTDGRYGLASTSDSLTFYLIFKDSFGNEVNNSENGYELSLTNESDNTNQIKFCKITQQMKKRQYYEICPTDVTKFGSLKKGNYFVQVDSNKFKFTMASNIYESDSSTAIPTIKSYLRNEDSIVTGRVDSPARIIIDFRSNTNLRYTTIDVSKIKIISDNLNMNDLTVAYLYGPLKGLVTGFISTSFVGSAKLTVSYNNENIISGVQYTNNAGNLATIKYLESSSVAYSEGKFYLFQISDKAANKCDAINIANTQINTLLLNIYSSQVGNYISSENTYNPASGVLSVRIENKISNDIKFDSVFLTEPVIIKSLTNNFDFAKSFGFLDAVTDATVSTNTNLYIETLDSFYNKLTLADSEVNNFSLLVSVTNGENLNYINTFTPVTPVKDGKVIFAYTFTQPGDYTFIPLYKSIPMECNSCRRKVNPDVVDVRRTSLTIKSASGWNDKTTTSVYTIFQHTYPVFKLSLRDGNNYQINTVKLLDLTFSLTIDDGTSPAKVLETQVYQSASNGLFVYLTEKGRNSYISLKPITQIKLIVSDITNGESVEFANFILLNSDIASESNAACANDAAPVFNTIEETFRAGSDSLIEFNLKGCASQESTLFDNDLDFISSASPLKGKVIPMELNGKYLLVLSTTQTYSGTFILQFRDSKSASINVNVLPETSISKLSFSSAGTFTSQDLFAVFYITANDRFNNLVTKDDTLFFYNDIYVNLTDSDNKKTPYKVTFNTVQKVFEVQFPILAWGDYTVTSIYSNDSFVVSVKPGSDLYNSIAVVNATTALTYSLDVQITLRDIKYKSFVNQDIQFNNEFNFVYYTYNSVTGEEFSMNISGVEQLDHTDASKLSFKIYNGTPMFQFFAIIPYSSIHRVMCTTCIYTNFNLRSTYSFKTDNNKNKYSPTWNSNNKNLNTARENLIFIYENNQTVDFKATLATYNIATLSLPGSGTNLKFVGMNTIELNSQKLIGTAQLQFGTDSSSSFNFYEEAQSSLADVDPMNTRITLQQSIKLEAGKRASFYVEVRDKEGKVTGKETAVSLNNANVNFNIIKSSISGFYLVEILSETITKDAQFRVTINGIAMKEEIHLDARPSFPVELDVNTQKIIDWETVQYNLVSTDKYNNLVCDKRLNIVARIGNLIVDNEIFYDKDAKKCRAQFIFSGKAVLSSPLFYQHKSTTTTSMILENLTNVRVSSFASQVVLDQNSFLSTSSSPITITLKLISDSGYVYPSDTSKAHTSIRVYSVKSSRSRQLVNEITSIVSLITTLSVANLGINSNTGDYIITAVVDGTEISNSSLFRYYKSYSRQPTSIQLKVKTASEWNSLTQIYDASSQAYEKVELSYPFSLMLNFVNADLIKISIPSDDFTEAKITDMSDTLILTLDTVRNSETTLLLTVPKDKVGHFIHLPKGNYKMTFTNTFTVNNTINTIVKIVYLTVSKGLYQNNNIDGVAYGLPSVKLTDSFDLVSSGNENTINTNVGSFSKTSLCMKNSNNKIYNNYLDPDLLVVNNISTLGTNCNLYNSISMRGCLDFVLKCDSVLANNNYKLSLSYNQTAITSKISVFVDPKLPPSYITVVTPFPTTIQQTNQQSYQIEAVFDLLDQNGVKFQYVNSDNFEVYINNILVDRVNWQILLFNTDLKLILSNITYPPKSQKIEVIFKDSTGAYTLLSELSTTLTLTQAAFDPKKTVISFPDSYYAGDNIKFIVILKDSFANCFEADLDTTQFTASINTQPTPYTDFDITQQSVDSILCKRILIVSSRVNASTPPMTISGQYKLDFSYNATIISTTNVQVLANTISPAKSTLSVTGMGIIPVAQIQAGSSMEIQMTGTDAFYNPVAYLDVMQDFDLSIDKLIKDQDYFFSTKVDDLNTKILMSLTINVLGRYHLVYTMSKVPFAIQNGFKEVIVTSGICSSTFPIVNVPVNTLFTGSYGYLNIKCADSFNNTISNMGNEKFNVDIKGTNLEIVGEDTLPYDINFNAGIYSVKFLLAYQGIYNVKIFLNGHRYGNNVNITVLPQKCTAGNIMCSDKSCVGNVTLCALDTDYSICTDASTPFSCKVKGTTTCVAKSTDCDCLSTWSKCNGACLPSGMADHCASPIQTNCQIKLNTANYNSCSDGSCRFATSTCPNPLGCPLGYKPCGVGCIPRKSDCSVTKPNCKSTQVMCWDLSCADSLDNCPTGKTCNNSKSVVCPDGKCVESELQCTQPPTCNAPFSFLCNDFSCKKSMADCIKRPVCFAGQSLCENNVCANDCKVKICSSDEYQCTTGQCVANSLLCPTPMSCPADMIKCPSGACAENIEGCNFVAASNTLTCPIDSPLLCPDLSCVSDTSFCKHPVPCPSSAPFKCSNNECRFNLKDCPSTPTCPKEYPVLCSDGTCQKASYHCKLNKQSTDCKDVRCADGSCVNSISLCPNHVTCGEKQNVCWDGSCVNDVTECRDPKYIDCPLALPYRCQDGSCRLGKSSCSTVSICPSDRPVKCFDGSCKANLLNCPAYQRCGANMFSCPDGTCTKDQCNTIVTCPASSPFLCSDNSCKADIRDCASAPSCSGVICPDGLCVSNRQLCKFFNPCSALNPVRCQQGSCAASVDECYSIIRECPIGFVKCLTGGCRANEGLCPIFKCPSNLPVQCPEGTCTDDLSFCDSILNGCPFNTPFKCGDSTCVSNIKACTGPVVCNNGSINCPDGSCRLNPADCPIKNGCSIQKPVKCANGICIDSLSVCPSVYCPFEAPIKCANGDCVSTTAMCPTTIRAQDYLDCAKQGFDNYLMCADGRCVPTSNYCRPLYSCPMGFTRCSDGTCKLSSSLCAAASNCPNNRPVRCSSGKCVADNTECYIHMLCPPSSPIHCDKSGECVTDSTKCSSISLTTNGCSVSNPYKCSDGRCLKDQDGCKTVNIACNLDNPVLCRDGTCKNNIQACEGVRDSCADNYERCPDGTCVPKNSFWLSCKNKIGCPLVTPLRCADGENCVADPSNCKTTLACTSLNPVLCADKSCVTDAKFCNVLYPCPANSPVRCNNGFCASDDASCSLLSDLCPLSSPVKCPSGACVKKIMECASSQCKDNEFFCTTLSSCVSSSAACVGANIAAGAKPGTARVLQQTTIRAFASTPSIDKPENGCFSSAPYSCFDGTCRSVRSDCPVLPACNVLEYRCPNGTCQTDNTLCKVNNVICEEGLHKCEDGLCRLNCPAFNGCGLASPFQCTNGMCVKNIRECVGYSMCPTPAPFRCIDGACVSNPLNCAKISRLNSAKKMTVTVSKFDEVNIQFAFDKNRLNIARVHIPGNSIVMKNNTISAVNSNNNSKININEVPHTVLYNEFINYNNSESFTYNVSNALPASDGVLYFENAVLSPIFNISGEYLEDQLAHFGLITIVHNYYINNVFLTSDYCLAKLVDSDWICVDRKATDDQTTFVFASFGTYAVILNPFRQLTQFNNSNSSLFFFDNIKNLAIVLSFMFLVSLIVFYAFTRVVRYREKYKETKKGIFNMQNQIEEYKNMTTDVPGQTLGDNIAGILFTRNPAHTVTSIVKGSANDLENEIEDIQRKCRAVELQNKTMEEKIQDVSEEYKLLKKEIERMKK